MPLDCAQCRCSQLPPLAHLVWLDASAVRRGGAWHGGMGRGEGGVDVGDELDGRLGEVQPYGKGEARGVRRRGKKEERSLAGRA